MLIEKFLRHAVAGAAAAGLLLAALPTAAGAQEYTDEQYFGTGAGIAVRKHDPLAQELDAALAGLKADGTYERIRKKYFEYDISAANGDFARKRSQLNFTSADVNGVPSCHLTPSRSLNVIERPSGATCHDLASDGCGSSCLS